MAGGGKTLKITILGDSKSGQKAFQDVEASAGGFGSKLGSLFSVAGGFAVFTAGAAAVHGLTGAIKDSIAAAGESAQVQAQTEAVLKSTGGAAGITADQIGDLATKLSGITPIDDEVIQSGENMLLTFTNVKNGVGAGNDIFNQATQTLLDMSTAMGTAPKDAAIQLGKALNDPIKGISALSRVGVTFTDQQKEQIKTMVESGDVMGAQKVILAELNKEFGGSAEAAGKTLPGQLAILKTALGNVQEAIGGALLPVLVRLANFAVPLVIQGVALLSTWLPRITEMLSGPLSSAFDKVSGVMQRVAGGVKTLIAAFQQGGFSEVLSTISQGLLSAFQNIDWGAIASALQSGLGTALATLANIGGQGLGLAQHLLTLLISSVQSIDWGAVGSAVLSGLSSAFSILTSAGSGALGLGSSLLSMLTSAFQSIDWGQVGSTLLSGLAGAFSALSTGAGMAVNFGQQLYTMILSQVTTTDWSGIAASMMSGITSAMNAASGAIGGAQDSGGVIGRIFGDASTILSKLQPVFDAIMGGLQPIIDNLQTSFAPVLAQLNTSWAQLQPTIQTLIPVLEALGALIAGVIVVEIGVWLGVLGGLVGMLTGALPGAIQAATGVIQIFGGELKILSSLILGIVKVVNDALHGDWSQAWVDAKQAVQGMADGVTQIISGLGNVISGLISGMVGAINGLISGFVDTIIGYFQSLYDSLVGHSIIPDMIAGIVAAFTGMPGQILGIISGLVSDIIGKFSDLATQMLSKGGEIISNLASGITSAIGGVQTAIGSVKGAITGAFAGAAGWLTGAGADIIRGLISGVTSLEGTLQGAVQAIADHIPSWAKERLGINSPAKVMIPIGESVIEGLALGMSNTDALITAADSTSGKLVDAMITGIVNGVSSDTMVPRLTKALLPSLLAAQQNAANALDLAKISGASDDDLVQLQAKLDAATSLVQRWQEYNQETVDQFAQEAVAAASTPVTAISDAVASQIKKLMGSMTDGGASLIDSIVSGIESGKVKLNQAMQLIPASALPKIQDVIDALKEKLAQALIDGTDPGPIQANLQTLTELFAALSAAAADSADAIMQVAVAIGDYVEGKGYKTAYGYTNVKPGSSSSGGGGAGTASGGAAASGLPNGTPANVQKYYDTYYTPDELTYKVQNGQAITVPKKDVDTASSTQSSSTTNIHGDIYVTQQQPTSLDDLLRGLSTA